MGMIPYSEKIERDQVTIASANTYLPIAGQQGLSVDVNTSSSKTRSVGGTNPVYPDVVVWKPAPGLNSGTAVVIEAIETPTSITQDIQNLQKLGSLGIPFTVIVPDPFKNQAEQILTNNNIHYDRLQTYKYNPTTGQIEFRNIK